MVENAQEIQYNIVGMARQVCAARLVKESDNMDCKFRTDLGTVTVNEEVLLKIASYTALSCYGIVAMASKSAKDGLVQLWNRDNLGRGVRLRACEDYVDVDLFIVVEYSTSIGAVANSIIDTVKYNVEHLTGVKVNKVNVSIEDIRV